MLLVIDCYQIRQLIELRTRCGHRVKWPDKGDRQYGLETRPNQTNEVMPRKFLFGCLTHVLETDLLNVLRDFLWAIPSLVNRHRKTFYFQRSMTAPDL